MSTSSSGMSTGCQLVPPSELPRLVREVGFRPRFTTVDAIEDYVAARGAAEAAA